LEGCIARDTQGTTQLKRYPQGTRRFDGYGVFAYQADLRGRDAIGFEIMCQPAYGARTGGSNRYQENGIHLILGE
jgi:hypothetical protein